jgi:hypothetical protein
MVYIIQTNTSLDNENQPRDFQSMMFKYSSWEDYKHDLINEDVRSSFIIGTMMGNIKPRQCKIETILINDDFHLECIISNHIMRINIKAYSVKEHQFSNLL